MSILPARTSSSQARSQPNPGQSLEVGGSVGGLLFKLPYNVAALVSPQQWPLFASVFAFTIPLLIARRRDIADRAVRVGTFVTLGVFTASIVLVGVITEVRVFADMIPVVSVAVAAIIAAHLAAAPPSVATTPDRAVTESR